MQNRAPTVRIRRKAVAVLGWLLPAAVVAIMVAGPDRWALLILAVVLIGLAWAWRATAQADVAIRDFLARWPIGAVARPLTTTADLDEPANVINARRPTARIVVAVTDGDALCGVIGPKQLARASHGRRMRCRDVMVPVGDIELLRTDAVVAEAMPRLKRFGFAVVSGCTPLRYVEVGDLLEAILVAESVKGIIRDSAGAKG